LKLTPVVVLFVGLALATLGQVLVALGVIHGSLFLPGVYAITIALIVCAAAGIFASVRSEREPT